MKTLLELQEHLMEESHELDMATMESPPADLSVPLKVEVKTVGAESQRLQSFPACPSVGVIPPQLHREREFGEITAQYLPRSTRPV